MALSLTFEMNIYGKEIVVQALSFSNASKKTFHIKQKAIFAPHYPIK